jgi:hypothetical protein
MISQSVGRCKYSRRKKAEGRRQKEELARISAIKNVLTVLVVAINLSV